MSSQQSSEQRDIHIVGSVPLPTVEDVFQTLASALGARVKRLPDGEVGERGGWIQWQVNAVQNHPQLVIDDTDRRAGWEQARGEYATTRTATSYRIADGVDPADLKFKNIGYADAALDSYEIFKRLKSEGIVPKETRFQVCLPTPLAFLEHLIARPCQADVEGPYEARMLAEMNEIVDQVPHNELAFQWDVAKDMGVWEGVWTIFFEDVKPGIIERLVRIGNAVPEDVELGYHLCYGDLNHVHWKEPENAANLVEVANGIAAGLKRPMQWLHIPVPRDRDDDAYFEPLNDLKLRPETELFLGLIHYTDGVEGTNRRIATAKKFVFDFGIGTECGMGRRPPETFPELLRIHTEV
jgi:hypothetical protein